MAKRLGELERKYPSLGENTNSLMSNLGTGFTSNLRVSKTGMSGVGRFTPGAITIQPFIKLKETCTRLETQMQDLKVAEVDSTTQKLEEKCSTGWTL